MRGILIAAALFVVAGCGRQGSEPAPDTDNRSGGASAGECSKERFEGSLFTICAFDPNRDELRLAWRDRAGRPLGSFAALSDMLGPDLPRLRFAMNAGMYDEQGSPIGLYVEKGEALRPLNLRKGPGNFHLLPNGVFAVDAKGRPSVTSSPTFRKKVKAPLWATQSGPMLVIDGKIHPRFDHDGASRLIRNGVGVSDGRAAFFVVSEEGVSFGRFARLFRNRLGCTNALFLDGTISSLWDPSAGRVDAAAALGPMLLVLRRERRDADDAKRG